MSDEFEPKYLKGQISKFNCAEDLELLILKIAPSRV